MTSKNPSNDLPIERLRAVVVLEVLAGIRSCNDAAADLSITLQSYYQLEERAVKGLVAACEPKPPGPRRNFEREAEELRQERDRLQSENARYQAIVRTSQLTVGLDPDKACTKKRNRKPTVRALRAIDKLESKAKSK